MKAVTPESQVESGAAWIGTPEQIKAAITRGLELTGPIEHASLQVNFGSLGLGDARSSIRLFAEKVMPAFAKDGGLGANAQCLGTGPR
jgi:hypothetical protein